MATITTSTASTSFSGAFGYTTSAMMDYNVATGELWIVLRPTNNAVALYKSSDLGVSWSSQGSFSTAASLLDICGMRIDSGGDMIHLVLFFNDGTHGDQLLYKRIDIRSGAPDFSSGTVAFSGNGTSSQAFEYSADLYARKNEDGSYHIFIAAAQRSTSSGITVYVITVKNDGAYTTFSNNGIIGPTRTYKTSGDDTQITCSLDVEHNGDGVTSAKPNIWVSWLDKTTLYAVKVNWTGYKTGWQTPSKATTIATGRTATRDAPGRWDGTRFIITQQSTANTAMITVFERNAANTATVKRTSPAHPSGAVGNTMISYNYVTQDLRIFAAVGAGQIFYVDYIRATDTWGSWTNPAWTAPLVNEWGLRRGTYGTAQYDVFTETGGGSPWTISNQILAVNFAPTAPTWITGQAGTVSMNGAAFDVSASLVLDWKFNDPNKTDTQGSYALSRQIGAGTVQWWRTSDSTWQVAEVQNTSSTSAVTLTTAQWLGGGGAADPAHVYKVKTWDAAGTPSVYSSGLSVVPSTRVDPTLTAPAPAAILNVGMVTATWTVSEQGSYRILLTNTVTGATVSDSGVLTDPTPLTPSILSYTVPSALPDGFAGTISLTTRNAEGLPGTVRTANFTIDFVEPVAPFGITTAAPTLGGINVFVGQVSPVGTQPASSRVDLYRRKVISTSVINANPFFETDASDWQAVTATSVARSTVKAHSNTASLLLTPNGVASIAQAAVSAFYPVVQGTIYEWRAWMNPTTANKTCRVALNWWTSAPAFISSTVHDITPAAGAWVFGMVQGYPPPGAASVQPSCALIGTPAAGDTAYIDEAVLRVGNIDNGIRIGLDIVVNSTILDWRAVTGVAYEYRGYAEASNGTLIFGPWAS